jgi:nitrite reductase/ring-hydroxylating ferredoxin subunit
MTQATAVEVCDADRLWDGEMAHFCIGRTSILLLRLDGRFHAYQAHCPHLGVALADGELDGVVLTCSAHRWQFDAANGQGVNPRSACLRRFPVRVVGQKVVVECEPEPASTTSKRAG